LLAIQKPRQCSWIVYMWLGCFSKVKPYKKDRETKGHAAHLSHIPVPKPASTCLICCFWQSGSESEMLGEDYRKMPFKFWFLLAMLHLNTWHMSTYISSVCLTTCACVVLCKLHMR
jgi:hypothetical protein